MKKVFKKATATVTAAAMLASLTLVVAAQHPSATTAAPAADTKAEGGRRDHRGSSFRYRQQGHQDRCFHLVFHRRSWFPV